MPENSTEQTRELLDSLYRVDSGRILATLIRLLGDFDLAEEAMHEAFAAALTAWPSSGVPDNPRPWLISTARFKAIDSLRRATQHDPVAADGWYELGRAYMKVSEWKPALKALEEARKLNFDSSHLYSAMAMCYLKTRKKQEAKQKAGEALQRDAANEEAKRVQRLVS